MKKIAFAGTDGRTLLCALVVSTATSDEYPERFQGVVVRGTPSMPKFCEIMNWPVEFIATQADLDESAWLTDDERREILRLAMKRTVKRIK